MSKITKKEEELRKEADKESKRLQKIKDLMREIDAEVRRLTDAFSFLLTYRQLFRGTGLEFAQLKEYVPGQDDATRIDWKASLRTGRLFIKQYEEERNLNIIVLLDACASMKFGTQKKLKREYASVIAGAIISAGIEIGDNIGFGMYSEDIITFLPPSNDETQYYRALRMMVDDDLYGGKCNLDKALRYILNNVEENSMLFIISDFIGMGWEWESSLKMVSNKLNDVMGIMVRDLRDEFLPKGSGNFRFKDPFSDKTLIVDLGKAKKEYERLAREQSEKVKKIFRSSNAGFIKVFTHEPFVKPLVMELRIRRIV
ncbi:MAG: DUF58 domain-containing protein [Candidatus Aenigmarchaeota archaeon]|nr:DUF58 domain-containing protein [Candidatus Aenigmarchaeota archaeon]